jgi:hypothetical protein
MSIEPQPPRSQWRARIVAKSAIAGSALGYLGGALYGTAGFPLVGTAIVGAFGGCVGAAAGTLVGAVLSVSRLPRALDLGRRPMRCGPGLRSIYIATVACVVLGGGVGLILGLVAYPPTAPFAIIEGAGFGALLGPFVGAVFVPVVMLMARLEADE